LRIEAAVLTHRGSARGSNEDCVASGTWLSQDDMEAPRVLRQAPGEPFCCVVADGMGGHNDGEQASRLVASLLAQRLAGAGASAAAGVLRAVNEDLHAHVARRPALMGMGSTAVSLSVNAGELVVANVGDSRAYRVERDALVQLSVDDSLDTGWRPGSLFARSGMLTQCFGGYGADPDFDPHVHAEPCRAGSTYLLCSDGLYETLDEQQLLELVGADLAASAQAILEAALRHFAADNVSLALVRLGG
jgi:serine/threonine protein phosphatase PrpC